MSFREQVALKDGVQLQLRAIDPSDKAGLAEGFARLSPDSRRMRFHATKASLSETELRFLTECDGHEHYAIVATCDNDSNGNSMGVGVARLVRTDGDVAELAITVVDTWQRRGVGGLLLQRIIAAAAERRIGRLRAMIMADNEKMKRLIRRHLSVSASSHENGLLVLDHQLSPQAVSTGLCLH